MLFKRHTRLMAEEGGDAGATGGTPPAAGAAPAAPAGDAGKSGNAAPLPADPGAKPADGGGKPAEGAKPQTWPDTWRDLMAGELPETADETAKAAHAKTLAALKRYNSPNDVAKALRAAQVKLSDGTVKAALPKDATPEQVAEWRKENGIPETPDKYDLGLPSGVVLADGDKALLDAWVTKVHGVNASPDVVKAGAAALIELRDAQAASFQQRDKADQAAFEDEMRAEWGADYRGNVEAVKLMLNHGGEDLFSVIAGARGPDGKGLANNPVVVRWLASHAREMGFVQGTVVPAGGDLGKGIEDEIAGLEKRMADDMPGWRKDTKAQARYMQLLGARDRMKKAA